MSKQEDRTEELNYIRKSMEEIHQIRQVCLDVLNTLEQPITQSAVEYCKSELHQILFKRDEFLG